MKMENSWVAHRPESVLTAGSVPLLVAGTWHLTVMACQMRAESGGSPRVSSFKSCFNFFYPPFPSSIFPAIRPTLRSPEPNLVARLTDRHILPFGKVNLALQGLVSLA
jgi:hypothetical protein